MTWQRSVGAAIKALKREEQSLAKRLDAVREKIADLEEVGKDGAGVTRRASSGKRRLSEKGRQAISRAAKRRWAKYRADQKKAAQRKSKR